ncbi:MAG: YegP family protein [Firmicutes bacterium]|nr:YegP family protein [Bacillota bacterium]
MAHGKFTWKTTASGKFHFNLVASNGQVIASSQTYDSKDSCLAGIESVRKNAASHVEDQTVEGFATLTHPKYEVYVDKAGEFRFRLKARNGENIVGSEGYKAKASCLNGIESIKNHAPEATVVEEEEK